MSNVIPTFSTFGSCTIRLDHRIPDFVAMEAAKHELALAWAQANAEAQQVPGRILDQIKVGPTSKSNVETLLNTARDYSINLSTDPMPALIDAIQARLGDHRKHFEAAIPDWAMALHGHVQAAESRSELAAVLAEEELRQELAVRIPHLRHALDANEAATAANEKELRMRTERLERTLIPASKSAVTKAKYLDTRNGKLAMWAGIGVAAALLLVIFAKLPLLPVPTIVASIAVIVGVFGPVGKQPDELPQIDASPFLPLRGQFTDYTSKVAETERIRRQLQLADGLLQELDRGQAGCVLPSAFQAVQRTLEDWQNEIPALSIAGNAADEALITGMDLVRKLWKTRAPIWSTSVFEENLSRISGKSSMYQVVRELPAGVAAGLLCKAAAISFKPVTLAEAVALLLVEVDGGKEQLLGEIKGDIELLTGLLAVAPNKLSANEAACPLLFHVCVPAELVTKIGPTLQQALVRQSFEVYASGDSEIRIIFETFNWGNEERAGHSASAHALSTYSTLASAERWSASCLVQN